MLKEVYIEITNKCYLDCKHCSSEAGVSNSDFIDVDTLFRLINESKELGVSCLNISGGEPLAHPDIEAIVTYANKLSMQVRLYSCGVLLMRDSLTNLDLDTLKTLKNTGLDTIIFSLYGTPPVHEFITGVEGSYDLAISSIVNAKRSGLNVEIHIVPMKVNYQEIRYILDEAEKLGVKQVSLLRYVPQGRSRNNNSQLQMSDKEHSEFIGIIKNLTSQENIRIGAPYTCLFQDRFNSCSAGKNKVLIGANGDAYPCEAFKTVLKGNTSNIYKRSLNDIWENDKMLNEIRNLKVEEISTCKTCTMSEICQAGCHGQRYFLNNSLKIGPDPICQYAK